MQYFPNMIVPSFRLYHFAVKLIWKRILYGKRDACLARIRLVADADGGWHLFSIYGCKVDAADDTT